VTDGIVAAADSEALSPIRNLGEQLVVLERLFDDFEGNIKLGRRQWGRWGQCKWDGGTAWFLPSPILQWTQIGGGRRRIQKGIVTTSSLCLIMNRGGCVMCVCVCVFRCVRCREVTHQPGIKEFAGYIYRSGAANKLHIFWCPIIEKRWFGGGIAYVAFDKKFTSRQVGSFPNNWDFLNFVPPFFFLKKTHWAERFFYETMVCFRGVAKCLWLSLNSNFWPRNSVSKSKIIRKWWVFRFDVPER